MHAVLADIHGNLEGLTAVLEDVRSEGIQRVICLGDLIGFGPDPGACVEIAMGFETVLRGCFDHRLFDDLSGYNPTARGNMEHAVAQISAGLDGKRRMEFMRELPLTHEEDGLLYAHAFPADSTWPYRYLPNSEQRLDAAEASRYAEMVRPAIDAATSPTFVGHSHQPSLIRADGFHCHARELAYNCLIDPNTPCVIDVGAVGWPQDMDPRASYAIVDGETVRWRRVEYDHHTTRAKMLKFPLPTALADFRLQAGF